MKQMLSRVRQRKLSSKGRRAMVEMKLAKLLIKDLKNFGPAGLIHLKALSTVIRKPIEVWRSGGRFCGTINRDGAGEDEGDDHVRVEYQDLRANGIGHWTLLGNRDPTNVKMDLNSCLFSVIASQTGKNVAALRSNTAELLTDNINFFTDQMKEFLLTNKGNWRPLMIGGARYNGSSPNAAAIVLDNSQNAPCHGFGSTGHPRGHASDRSARGPQDSVENYSRITGSMKSGFLNRNDQNKVAHFALKHATAQRAMRKLNNGFTNEAVTFSAHELQTNGHGLPKMKEYLNGNEYTGELNIVRLTLVFRHHLGKQNDPETDVFVHTFYPRRS